jgi:hypothetical protein
MPISIVRRELRLLCRCMYSFSSGGDHAAAIHDSGKQCSSNCGWPCHTSGDTTRGMHFPLRVFSRGAAMKDSDMNLLVELFCPLRIKVLTWN